MEEDLFSDGEGEPVQIAPDAFLLRQFALKDARQIYDEIMSVTATAAFRHMALRRGRKMSVALSNCGDAGWISDSRGYRYSRYDPLSGEAWPLMPEFFAQLATKAAVASGFPSFHANACLINRYEIGARLSLHQDKDEGDFSYPIVSVSLGLPAKFLFGGLERSHKVKRLMLQHSDVCVFGGRSRLAFHGIDPLKTGHHPLTGSVRYNLTFRRTELIAD